MKYYTHGIKVFTMDGKTYRFLLRFASLWRALTQLGWLPYMKNHGLHLTTAVSVKDRCLNFMVTCRLLISYMRELHLNIWRTIFFGEKVGGSNWQWELESQPVWQSLEKKSRTMAELEWDSDWGLYKHNSWVWFQDWEKRCQVDSN